MERLNDKDYLVADTTYRSYYEVKPDKIVINDAVWNSQEIGEQPGDDVFRALIHNPLVIRSSAIEQLTLGPYAATVPSTANFSRWEHVWGGVLLTRSLTENQDMTPEEKTTYQLRAFVSDLGHTAQSHLGDWISQGVGGQEDLHDSDLTNLLGVSGVNRILNYYGHNPDDIIFPDITDFVERPSPDLCIDRLDYSAREIRRWLNLSQDINEATTPQSFELIDGEIVMSSHWLAKALGKASLLLATEHWSEPVHRLQLRLQEAIVKDILRDDESYYPTLAGIDVSKFHPRDIMFSVDSDIDFAMNRTGALATYVLPIMRETGFYRRRLFTLSRRDELGSF
jgi:hypothetical protein